MAEGGPPSAELTSISFRDQMWLNAFALDRSLVFDYFALSPFYDRSCNNEQLRMRSIHPLDMPNLQKMLGIEYILHEAQEPHLFVFRKQKRDGPEKATPVAVYYVLDGSIYQSPQLYNVMGSRVARSLYHITKAFSIAAAKLEKIGYSADGSESKQDKKTGEGEPTKIVDVTEVVRIDQILGGILRKLPPAPPPPAVPTKVGAPSLTESTQPHQAVDPVTGKAIPLEVQGASKRLKMENV